MRGIDRSDLEATLWQNPHAHIGDAGPRDNKNAVIHTDAEAFPWQGTARAVHVLRLFSVALGAVTVALAPAIARATAPGHPAVAPLAMALTAFNPMFVFISGAVNNDNLNIALTTLALFLSLRLLRDGLRARWVVALSVALALASLSKISGLAFYPLAALVLLIAAARGAKGEVKPVRALAFSLLALVGVWLAVAGWWYWRNIALYGEPLGLETMVAIAGPRDPVPSYLDLLAEFEGFRRSYWGVFGWFNVLAGAPFYIFTDLLATLAAVGLAWWGAQRARARRWDALLPPALLAAQVAVVALGVLSWTRQTPASQGRLMFPRGHGHRRAARAGPVGAAARALEAGRRDRRRAAAAGVRSRQPVCVHRAGLRAPAHRRRRARRRAPGCGQLGACRAAGLPGPHTDRSPRRGAAGHAVLARARAG
ncbi:MAG: DUF2142 domain-containing protein [Anaerolineae bacterium]|nr:DUF2142 domain-containing protein [Anaerolineae bacterium]